MIFCFEYFFIIVLFAFEYILFYFILIQFQIIWKLSAEALIYNSKKL